jgi:predicted esterase
VPREVLERAGAEVLYRETPMFHQIDPAFVREVADWLTSKVAESLLERNPP